MAALGLVADVGRQSVCFGMVEDGPAGLRDVRRFHTADRPTFTDALVSYLRGLSIEGQPLPAVLAVSGAARGDIINLTGSRWYVSLPGVAAVLRSPVRAINEAAATALALTRLHAADLHALPGPPIGPPAPPGCYLLLAPGTGLGCAALSGDGVRLWPVQSEAAHMQFVPQTPGESALVDRLARGGKRVTNETVASAGGIQAAFAALGGPADTRPEEITRAAARRDQRALDAVALFVGALGSIIGELALAFGAWDGVFLAGPIARALRPFLAGGDLRQRIEGRRAFRRQISQLPIAVVGRGDLELVGAATALGAWEAQPSLSPAR